MEQHKAQPPKEGVTALDYLIFVMKWKRLITLITVSCFAAIVIISMFLPKKYLAETKVLLPQQGSQSLSLQVQSQLGLAALPNVLSGGVRTTSDLYAALLKSRAVLDRVIDRFNLMKVYRETYREDARQNLVKALSIQDMKKSGMIIIGVEDRDPARSAELANAFVEELRNLTQYIAVTEASQRRLFFEEQLKNTKEALIRAEESMKGYQEQTGAIEIKEQTKAIIESIAQLRAQIAAKEVELKVLRSYATPKNPDLQKIEEQLRGMREQLSKLEAKGGKNPDTFMSAGSMPEAGTGYVRKLRNLKYSETLYELMAKQYEMAKIDEAKDAMVIQVVDKAAPPEKQVKPRRVFLVASVTLLGLLISFVTAIILEYRERVSLDPAKRERIERLKAYAAGRSIKENN